MLFNNHTEFEHFYPLIIDITTLPSILNENRNGRNEAVSTKWLPFVAQNNMLLNSIAHISVMVLKPLAELNSNTCSQ